MLLETRNPAFRLFGASRRESLGRALPVAAVVGSFLFVLAAAATLALSLSHLEEGFQQVGQTERVLRHATRLAKQIGNAEVAGRGYMLAAEPAFLTRLNKARQGISTELQALMALSAANPAQLQRLDQLSRDLRLHLGTYNEDLAPGDPQLAALLAHLRDSGLRMDPKVDTALSDFREAEFLELRQRQAQAAADSKYALALSLLTLILALVSGGSGLYLVFQQRARAEVNKLRDEFAHVSRLNAMGEIATTLAHEVKQPLTASTNYLSVARRQLANDEIDRSKITEIVNKVSAQVGRAVDIIQHLRAHVSRSGDAVAPEDVEATINEAIELSGIVHENIFIGMRLPNGLPPVCIDKVQIQQVLVNLMRNATEAMAESPRRCIVLSARPEDGGMVRIEVRDTGPGLPDGVRENLFKPFITTKPGGMGVGLSICLSIIQAHGGNISAEAAPDGGTVFAFTVPQA